jgi:ELWxxDGT repeat protein
MRRNRAGGILAVAEAIERRLFLSASAALTTAASAPTSASLTEVPGNGPVASLTGPTSLQGYAAYATTAHLEWAASATPITKVSVERADGDGPFTEIALLAKSRLSYDDGGLAPYTPYRYRVRGLTSASGYTDYSNEITVTTFTPSLTTRAAQLPDVAVPSPLYPTAAAVTMGGVAYFAADDFVGSQQLYRTDGTPGGTYALTTFGYPFTTTSGSYLTDLTVVGDTLYFVARLYGSGDATLYKSDGTAAGTVVAANVWATNLVNLNGTLYFRGGGGPAYSLPLWKSDGTPQGTVIVKQFGDGGTAYENEFGLVESGGVLYLSNHGLWKSDGTTEGTVPVRVATQSPSGAPASVSNLGVFGGRVYFASGIDADPYESLWVSDDTTAGTVRIEVQDQLLRPSDTEPMVGVGGRVFFVARTWWNDYDLWVTDGTNAGTHVVKDVSDGPPRSLTVLPDGRVAFIAGDGLVDRLWVTDGTDAGTKSFATYGVSGVQGGVTAPKVFGSSLYYFAPNPGPTWTLYKSDVTPVGTHAVVTFNGSIRPSPLSDFGAGKMFFGADDGVHGAQPYVTDGTAAGTTRVRTVTHPDVAHPDWMVGAGSVAYFTSTDRGLRSETTAGTAGRRARRRKPPCRVAGGHRPRSRRPASPSTPRAAAAATSRRRTGSASSRPTPRAQRPTGRASTP